ncbi:MAG: glycosyltransferase family 2 protein [Pseudochelatococcus sp.]|jgi:hypothetical protein|uniref:glycosyltransferase family 2 protein n=1 Tax=Pseudochelatococcus sp. TaxID=2020869 RepID=UPI003D928861
MTSDNTALARTESVAPGRPVWERGTAPIAVVMISLNEAHNMADVLENLKGFAQEVFLVDSYSSDETVGIALAQGVHVVQRKFRGFGDQWNFAMRELPITAPWTMKLDPDERLTDELKQSIAETVAGGGGDAFTLARRLWFMGKPLPIVQVILRGWKTGTCKFSDVVVNEHPLVEGAIVKAQGYLEHYDSPDLHHWVDKQNRYTSFEAISLLRGDELAATPNLFGTSLERRMWFKKNFVRIPARYSLTMLLNLIQVRAWRTGRVGFAWARLRTWARRLKEDKMREMTITGRQIGIPSARVGKADPRVRNYDSVVED